MSDSDKEHIDMKQAGETLKSEAEQEIAQVTQSYDPANLAMSAVRIEPRRSDTAIQQIGLAWIPCVADSFSALRPAIPI